MGHSNLKMLHELGRNTNWIYLWAPSLHGINYQKVSNIFLKFYNYFMFSRYLNFFFYNMHDIYYIKKNVVYKFNRYLRRRKRRKNWKHNYCVNFYLMNYQRWVLCFIFFYYKMRNLNLYRKHKDIYKLHATLWRYHCHIGLFNS